jgi:hypothetical protein
MAYKKLLFRRQFIIGVSLGNRSGSNGEQMVLPFSRALRPTGVCWWLVKDERGLGQGRE